MAKESKYKVALKLGDREIPVILTAYETKDIQQDIGCTVAQLWDQVFGIEKVLEDENERTIFHVIDNPDMQRKLGTLIRICGNAGLEEYGEEPFLTDKWVLRHIKPSRIIGYALAMMGLINMEMYQESSAMAEGNSGPVDEILEEENRKKEQGN